MQRTVIISTVTTLAAGLGSSAVHAQTQPPCEPGQFCTYSGSAFTGVRHTWELTEINTHGFGDCIPLQPLDESAADGTGVSAGPARSAINRSNRPVTLYQGADCSAEGEFVTLPGWGAQVPETPFLVRAYSVSDS